MGHSVGDLDWGGIGDGGFGGGVGLGVGRFLVGCGDLVAAVTMG